jgi:hypothetical protein
MIVTINMKRNRRYWILERTGLANPGETHGLMGMGPRPGLTRQLFVGRIFSRVWSQTDLCSRCTAGQLVGYLDMLLTLAPFKNLSYDLIPM